ncbi:MAG: hypothetical protein IPG96_07555 [Proteobacteria bacterium]|nr:hypothetical protein [Pseudomonadota bacterium]
MTNAASCAAWRTCAAGTFIWSEGRATSDRVCTPCWDGYYSSSPNQADAWASVPPRGPSSCAGHQYVADLAATRGPRAPTARAVASAVARCAAGWDNDGSPRSNWCAPETTCGTGRYVVSEGTTTADRTCAACASGTFSAVANTASCTEWSTCAAGSYVSTAGTERGDRVCTPCAASGYTSGPNQAACVAKTICVAGQYVASEGGTADCVAAAWRAGPSSSGGTRCVHVAWRRSGRWQQILAP